MSWVLLPVTQRDAPKQGTHVMGHLHPWSPLKIRGRTSETSPNASAQGMARAALPEPRMLQHRWKHGAVKRNDCRTYSVFSLDGL